MNIFFLDENPERCAEYHCDKHVSKLLLESCQLLCNVFWSFDIEAPYRKTHYNHPCAIWTRASYENFIWLYKLAFYLSQEYTLRYGKSHKCEEILAWICKNFSSSFISKFPEKSFTSPALIIPANYKTSNTVEAYRNFYIHEKSRFARWEKLNNQPYWWTN